MPMAFLFVSLRKTSTSSLRIQKGKPLALALDLLIIWDNEKLHTDGDFPRSKSFLKIYHLINQLKEIKYLYLNMSKIKLL